MSIPGVPPLEPAPAEEEFTSRTLIPVVSFRTKLVDPPSASYVGRDDRLIVELRNAVSGLTVHVHVRLLLAPGELLQSLHSFTPTADRALNSYTIYLAEGFLLGLTVDAVGDAKPGSCYCRVRLAMGSAPTIPIPQVLLAGYVVTGSALVWPGARYVGPAEGPGRVRWITGTTPSAGSGVYETVPTGARWDVRLLSARFTTNTVAGNRYVHFILLSGSDYQWFGATQLAHAANTQIRYEYAAGAIRAYFTGLDGVQDALPYPLILTAGMQFGVGVSGMDAGDQWDQVRYLVEEWIEP